VVGLSIAEGDLNAHSALETNPSSEEEEERDQKSEDGLTSDILGTLIARTSSTELTSSLDSGRGLKEGNILNHVLSGDTDNSSHELVTSGSGKGSGDLREALVDDSEGILVRGLCEDEGGARASSVNSSLDVRSEISASRGGSESASGFRGSRVGATEGFDRGKVRVRDRDRGGGLEVGLQVRKGNSVIGTKSLETISGGEAALTEGESGLGSVLRGVSSLKSLEKILTRHGLDVNRVNTTEIAAR